MLAMMVEATVRSFALGSLVWLTLTLARSRNVHLQKMLWTTVLLASLAMPFLMRAHMAVPVAVLIQALLTEAPLLHGPATHSIPILHGAAGPLYLLIAYLLIAAALLARFISSLFKMDHIRRHARALTDYGIDGGFQGGVPPFINYCRGLPGPDIRVTDQLSTPATFGSTILLPAEFQNWAPQTLQAVLAHEQSHVRHRDSYMLWLARLYTCLFWINPLGWLIQRRLAALSETTSDEAAIAAVGDRPSYAEILLKFASQRATASSVAVAMARSNIPGRIDRILSDVAPSTRPKLSLRILSLVALFSAVATTAAPLSTDPPALKQPFDLETLKKYYPPDALRRGIEGMVQVQVTLDSAGHATDTLILSEQPQEMGFGAAASTLAHLLEYNNPSHRPNQLTFNVKFALPPQPQSGPGGTTLFTNPEEP